MHHPNVTLQGPSPLPPAVTPHLPPQTTLPLKPVSSLLPSKWLCRWAGYFSAETRRCSWGLGGGSVVFPPFCRLPLLTFPSPLPLSSFLSPSQSCQVSTKVSRPSPVKRRRGSSPRSGEAGSHHTGSGLVQHPNSCGTR